MNAGVNSYLWNVHALETTRVNRVNFAVAQELGVDLLSDFTISMRYLLGGKTPEFTGDRGGNTFVSLEAERVNILMFSLAYRIKLW